MNILKVTESIFKKLGKEPIEEITDVQSNGLTMQRKIKRIVMPNAGDKLGWAKHVTFLDAAGEIISNAIELHNSRENAVADCPNGPHEETIMSVWVTKPGFYYSTRRSLYQQINGAAIKPGTDGENAEWTIPMVVEDLNMCRIVGIET
jgi:hypothetical protein